jgi:hypothetical protein
MEMYSRYPLKILHSLIDLTRKQLRKYPEINDGISLMYLCQAMKPSKICKNLLKFSLYKNFFLNFIFE